MRLRLRGGLGDAIATTALVRETKRRYPGELIVVEDDRAGVFLNNPNVGWGQGPARWGVVDLVLNRNFYKDPGSMPHSFAHQLGFELTDDTPEVFLTAVERAAAPPVPEPHRTVTVDPWTFWASRRWATERFAELVGKLRADGWYVVELGSRRRASGEPTLDVDASYFNQLGVRATAALLEKCALHVGNDSGMMHLAAAVGTPQVAIFGPVPWYARAYYTTTPVFAYSACGPHCLTSCSRRRPRGTPQHCLDEISVDRVFDAVRVAARRFPYRPAPVRAERRTVW